jgi:small-conductance mechanosensitive channel
MNVFLRLLKLIGILGLILLNENVEVISRNTHIPEHFLTGIIGFLIFFLIAETVKEILLYLYRKRKGISHSITDNVTVGLDNIYILLMAGAVFYLFLHLLNLRPKDFFTGITLISAAVAIIMKDYISNIISGMILAFSDKLKIGDYVQIGQFRGEIVDFSLTSMTLKNDDDELVYIPINIVFTHELVNFTHTDHDIITIDFEINNKMKLPFAVLESKINEVLDPFANQIIPGSTKLSVHAGKQESVVFKYRYTMKQRDLTLTRKINAEIFKAVYENTSMIKGLAS